MSDSDNDDADVMREKINDICRNVIDRCHQRLLTSTTSKIDSTELRNVMIVLRESWFLLNDSFMGTVGDMDAYMSDEDDIDYDDYEEEDDDDSPPHPLK